MARLKTRDRILLISQELFNICGEPNVSTVDIAAEMEISPGNLYYHFRNKEEIINGLFGAYEEHVNQALGSTELSLVSPFEAWLHIKLLFEILWGYRFLYRDINNILTKIPTLQRRFHRILHQKQQTADFILNTGVEHGYFAIPAGEKEALLNNILINLTFSYNFYPIHFQKLRKTTKPFLSVDADQEPLMGHDEESKAVHFAIKQISMLVLPYIEEPYRSEWLEHM